MRWSALIPQSRCAWVSCAIQLLDIAVYWLVSLVAWLFDKLVGCFVACVLVSLALRLWCLVLIAHGLELVSCLFGFGPASCHQTFQGKSVQLQVVFVLDERPEATLQPRHIRVARASDQNGPASLEGNELIV